MAYKKVGLIAVFDVANFLPNVTKFLSSIEKVNATVREATANTGAMKAPLNALGTSFGQLSIVAGAIITSQVFIKMSQVLQNVGRDALEAATQFQLLEQRFTTLAARDYMRSIEETTGAIVGMDEALQATVGAANETIEWVRRLAVTTPYTVQNLSGLIAYAQAAGFTNAEVKTLAQTIGDFSAGMGLTSQHVDRIIWNFAQMKSAGRVLGRELRDLGNSMVPVDYLLQKLAERYKTTKEEMKIMVQQGIVPVNEFFAEFNKMAETQFAGAMDRMANTFYTAKANIKDFIDTVIGLDILKPTLDIVGRLMNETLQALLAPSARRASVQFGIALRDSLLLAYESIRNKLIPALQELFRALGMARPTVEGFTAFILNLGFAVRFLSEVGAKAIRFIKNFINAISDVFGSETEDLANDAYGWGGEIIVMFAEGMAAAIGFVFDALNAVVRAFIGLKPSSPPPLLPDIDKWGADTMMEYLEGFSNADFSVFDDVGSMIEKYIRAFDLETADEISRILGGRGELAKVLADYGDLSLIPLDVIEQITRASGISNDTLTKYINAVFDLSEVTEQAARANELLDYSLGDIVVIQGEIIDSIDEFVAAASQYQGIGAQYVEAYTNALIDMQAAQIAADVAQKELNDTTAYYDKLLADLQAQQNKLDDELEDSTRLRAIDKTLRSVILTAEERERLELEKRGILLKREIRDTELARDKAVDAAQERADAAQSAMDVAKEVARVQKELAEATIKVTEDQIEAQVKAYERLLEIMIKNRDIATKMGKAGKEAGEGLEIPGFGGADTGTTLEDLTSGIETAIDAMKERLKKKWDALTADFLNPFLTLQAQLDEFKTNLENFSIEHPKMTQWIKDNPLLAAILGYTGFRLSGLALKNMFKVAGTVISTAWASSITPVLAKLGLSGGAIAGGALIAGLISALALLAVVIVVFGEDALNSLNMLGVIIDHWFKTKFDPWMEEQSAKIGEFVQNLIDGILEDIGQFFTDLWDSAFGPDGGFTKFWQDTKDLFDRVWKSLFGADGTFPNIISATGKFFTDWWNDIFGPDGGFTKFLADTGKFVSDLWGKFFDPMDGFFPKLIRDAGEWITNLWNDWFDKGGRFDTFIDDFAQLGKDFINGLISGLLEKATNLYNTIRDIIRKALGTASEESGSESPSKEYAKEGEYWIMGLIKGVQSKTPELNRLMGNLVDTAMNQSATVNLAAVMQKQRVALAGQYSSSAAVPTSTNMYNQTIMVTVNPTYENIQSPSSIYYDVTAALAASRR